ncbi:MAG: hemerythrin domain-containing protein [Chloroflexi bacterium]|nr:hemerythrin domain-containing protein [Chloroflexota bacterium]
MDSTGEITQFNSPIDVMYLIHKALRHEANRAIKLVDNMDNGGTLQAFKLAFNEWATNLMYHAEQEDKYITVPLIQCTPSLNDPTLGLADKVKGAILAHEDDMHEELLGGLEEVFAVLNDDIGHTSVITRTKQHLFGQVMTLRIVQEDHLDTEEALVLPMVRRCLSEEQQLLAAKELLLDEAADDPRWVINWISESLTEHEQGLLANLESRFQELPVTA